MLVVLRGSDPDICAKAFVTGIATERIARRLVLLDPFTAVSIFNHGSK